MAFSLENVFYHVHSSYNKLINTTFDYKFYFCLHRSFHQCPKTRSVIKQLYIYTLLERSADISPSAWAFSLKLGWLFYLCRRTNDLEATVSPWFSWLFFLISIQILFSVPSYIPFNLIPHTSIRSGFKLWFMFWGGKCPPASLASQLPGPQDLYVLPDTTSPDPNPCQTFTGNWKYCN